MRSPILSAHSWGGISLTEHWVTSATESALIAPCPLQPVEWHPSFGVRFGWSPFSIYRGMKGGIPKRGPKDSREKRMTTQDRDQTTGQIPPSLQRSLKEERESAGEHFSSCMWVRHVAEWDLILFLQSNSQVVIQDSVLRRLPFAFDFNLRLTQWTSLSFSINTCLEFFKCLVPKSCVIIRHGFNCIERRKKRYDF